MVRTLHHLRYVPLLQKSGGGMLDRRLLVRDSMHGFDPGVDMATVAARAPKRELAPDWRDALREAVRRLAVRTWGALLMAVSLAGAVAFGSHNPTDPSLSTAAGGPPANWLGSAGAYASDALLLMFGIGSIL